jgi:hypothetical protein
MNECHRFAGIVDFGQGRTTPPKKARVSGSKVAGFSAMMG